MQPHEIRRLLFDVGRRSILVAVLALGIVTLLPAVMVDKITTTRIPLSLGGTKIDLVVHQSDDAGLTYINLHDDENTAVEAALAILQSHGGVIYELRHEGERNITFQIGDATYVVDPNRIFTDQGIDATLARRGRSNSEARAAVRAFSDSLLSYIGFGAMSTLVTIHNNTEDRYSALSYAEGGDLADDAESVYLAPDVDPDDFYFVTTAELYDSLRVRGANVVLQDNALAQDDGSLSILAGREGIPYVNVEAQHGHVDAQRQMLEIIHQLLAPDAEAR